MILLIVMIVIVIIGFAIFGAETPSKPSMNNSKPRYTHYTKEEVDYLRKNLFK